MLSAQEAFQVLAVDASGHPQSVDMVPRGDACGCFCIGCGMPLTARQGLQRRWHFAHKGVECGIGCESVLHQTAKLILAEHRRVLLPPLSGPPCRTDGSPAGVLIEFDDVQLEASLETIRPDVLASHDGQHLAIEIKVSHGVGELKRAEFERLELRCMEIALEAGTVWTLETLTATVIQAPANRIWCYHPDTPAQARAEVAQVEPATLRRRGERHRLRLRGIPLHVNRFSWGLTLWAPYNEDNNRTMRSIAHQHGGFWNHKCRNWVVPAVERFDAVMADLQAVGALVDSRS
jgi:hypothetical protein